MDFVKRIQWFVEVIKYLWRDTVDSVPRYKFEYE